MRDALGAVQSVLLLGGTSDLGLATVRALLAERPVSVVLAVRDPEASAGEADALRAAGARAVDVVAFDALAPEHDAFVDELFDRHGDLDLVLVAFGLLGDQAESETDAAAARRVVDTNFSGVVSVMVPVVRRLRAQGHGTIVVFSSVAGERPRAANFVYGASKAGVDALAQGFADALVGTGVSMLVVRPGFVETKMTTGMDAAPFSTTADAVAERVLHGLRTGAHTVWAPAVLRPVMAVLRHLPRPIFRRLPG